MLLPRISGYPISPMIMRRWRVSSSMDHAAYSAARRKTVETSHEVGGTMDYDSCCSLPVMFFEQAERLGANPSCGPSGTNSISPSAGRRRA